MRSWCFALILICTSLFVSQRADARPLALSKRYETDKKLGVGLMLGIPSSVTAKLMLTDEWAVTAAAGMYLAYRDRTGFHGHLDVLWHPFVAVEGSSFLAPLYVGLGARLLVYDYSHVGIRLPVGISFDISDNPFEFFLEGAFVVDVSMPAEATGPVDMNAVVGVRYFLF